MRFYQHEEELNRFVHCVEIKGTFYTFDRFDLRVSQVLPREFKLIENHDQDMRDFWFNNLSGNDWPPAFYTDEQDYTLFYSNADPLNLRDLCAHFDVPTFMFDHNLSITFALYPSRTLAKKVFETITYNGHVYKGATIEDLIHRERHAEFYLDGVRITDSTTTDKKHITLAS